MEMPSNLNNYLKELNKRGDLDAYFVVENFTNVIDKYYSTVSQIETSIWHELGQASITTDLLPEVGTWLNVLDSNLDVLTEACNGYNILRSMLSELSAKIIAYNNLSVIDPRTPDIENDMAILFTEIENLKQASNEQISYLNGLSNKIGSISVDIKVPGANNTEKVYKLTLSDFVDEIGKNISKVSGLSDIEGYLQTDERWADKDYTPGVYGDSACGPTALATILSYCLGREVLPTSVGRIEGNGLLTNEDGTKYYAAVLASAFYGVKSKMVRDVNAEVIKTELTEGHPIVYGIKYKEGGHYIALTDIDENDIVTVKDPIGEISEMPLSELVERHKPGVALVSLTPKVTTVEDYNDFALLTGSYDK